MYAEHAERPSLGEGLIWSFSDRHAGVPGVRGVRAVVGGSGGRDPPGHPPSPFACSGAACEPFSALGDAIGRRAHFGPFSRRTHLSATSNFHIKSSGFLHRSQDFHDANQP